MGMEWRSPTAVVAITGPSPVPWTTHDTVIHVDTPQNSLSLPSLNHLPRLHTFLIKVHGIPIGLHTHEKPVPLLFLLPVIGSRRASLGIRSHLDLSWIWVCFHSSFWLLLLGC